MCKELQGWKGDQEFWGDGSWEKGNGKQNAFKGRSIDISNEEKGSGVYLWPSQEESRVQGVFVKGDKGSENWVQSGMYCLEFEKNLELYEWI